MTHDPAPLSHLAISPARRMGGLGCLLLLAAITLSTALSVGELPVWARVFLAATGGGALWCVSRIYTARHLILELRNDGIYLTSRTEERAAGQEGGARLLVGLDEIVRVDRGALSFRPSNGCLIALNSKKPRSWEPGLFWTSGRLVGIGGMVARHESKAFIDALSARINT